LDAYLRAAGGIAGDIPAPEGGALPAARAAVPFRPRLEPRRDARFQGTYNFEFPPQVVYLAQHVPADERNLALLCKRLLEMDVPEMMASFILERAPEQPWEFRRDYARQLWDEARHAMMGETAFTSRGIDWTSIPLNVGFALRLNLHASPFERQLVLWAIEQSLMPAETGKSYEFETARAAGDELSAHFQDYDWADEVLHAQIGRRWIRAAGLSLDEARERALEVHERTWNALAAYRDRQPQTEWWRAFVEQVLGHPSATKAADLRKPEVMSE
ncbi:MAG: hypothetical protein ACRELD_10555, partial [Longimicrobiales bacterium]